MRTTLLKVWGWFLDLIRMRRYLIFDMDGVLVNTYEDEDYMEKLDKKNFFLWCRPYYKMVEAVRIFREKHPDCGFAICSKPMDNDWCGVEKYAWVNTYTPWFKPIILVPQSENKSEFIKKIIKSKRLYVFDDYTYNCVELLMSRIFRLVIKVKNHINCKKGTWDGPILDIVNSPVTEIVANMERLIYGKTFP